ncbi:MAG: cell division protein ZapE [Shimia sp.]
MDVRALYTQTLEDRAFTRDPAQEAVLPEFQRIADALTDPPKRGWFAKAPEPPRGLYLWGGVGRGKSMLMDLITAAVPVPTRRVHFHAFMQDVHTGMARARAQGVDDAIKPVAEEQASHQVLLTFDEMQITDITDAMIVGRLFEQLFARGVCIVATSNRPPDDLYKDGLNRALFLPFIELLKERMVVHHLASDTDYRQSRLAGEQTYFIAPGATAELDRLWSALTDGAEETQLNLRVKGRTVTLPRYANGVGRTGFHDLCGQPLGPADYLAVAEALRVLILDKIPQLGRHNFNEAKRFVTLIDALYEARVRLIASAAAAPESLYIEGEGAFEFERTASRLKEMQSAGWGAPST